MRIVVIADTHAGVRNDSPAFLDNFQRSCRDFLFPYMKEHGLKDIIHLGDLVDRRKYVNIHTAYRLRNDFLDHIEYNDMHMTIIAGNHDEYYKNTNEVNFLTEFVQKKYQNISVITNPCEIIMPDGQTFLMLPWICDANYHISIETINKTKAQVAFGHLELKGFEMQRGQVADHGLDRKLFDKFDQVFTGHYHHRSSDGTVSYVGAFGEYTWGDYNDARGFSVYDTETREITFVPNPFVMHKKFFYDDSDNDLDALMKIDFYDVHQKYLKIIVKKKENPNMFDLYMDHISAMGPAEIQTVEDHLNLAEETEDHIVDEAEPVDVILTKYIDTLKLNNIDKPLFSMFMTELYKEAQDI